MADKVAAAVAAMALAMTLFAAGFGACTLPASTQLLAQATANDAESPYADGQLTALAVETRGFTVDDYGRGADGEDGARNRIAAAILDAAREASAEGSPVRGRWSAEARKAVAADADGSSPQAALDRLAAVDDAYALDGDALSHLDDCNVLVRTAVPMLWGVAALAAAALALSARAPRAAPGGGHRARRGARRAHRGVRGVSARGLPSTSTACSPPSTRCCSPRATGRSPTIRSSLACTRLIFGWAWPVSGLRRPSCCLYWLSSSARRAPPACLRAMPCSNSPGLARSTRRTLRLVRKLRAARPFRPSASRATTPVTEREDHRNHE